MVNVRQNNNSTVNIHVHGSSSQTPSSNLQMHDNTDYIAAGLAKDWAVRTDAKVENKDYSSKYYALQAKKSENLVREYMEATLSAIEARVPIATSSVLGGIKVGSNLSVAEDGTLSGLLTASWGNISGNLSAQMDLNEAIGAKANLSLDNINHTGLDKFVQFKALQSGSISNNSIVLDCITKMKFTTFDLSKFTVVGSPSITDDGIASGFSSSNYLTFNSGQLSSSNSWEVISPKIKVNVNNVTQTAVFWGNNTNGRMFVIFRNDGKILVAIQKSGNLIRYDSYTYNTSDIYQFKITYSSSNNVCTIYQSVNGGAFTQVQTTTISTTFNLYSSPSVIGFHLEDNNTPFTSGSIDLEQFSITVDGVEVFSGNRTGIDTIKPDNYTVVGTPTISADGIASGFSSSNYIKIANNKLGDFVNANNFVIYSPVFTMPTAIVDSNREVLLRYSSRYDNHDIGLFVAIYSNLKIACSAVTHNGTTYGWDYSTKALLSGHKYQFKFEFTGTAYKCSYKNISDTSWTEFFNHASTDKIGTISYDMILGQDITTASGNPAGHAWSSDYDLNAFRIYIDGNLVYQPCLKIPYIESKTGSKIIQSVYRDRVSDMYNQFGYAPYYTLSDTDFTLPQGELYGMYEKYRKQTLNDMMPDYANGIAIDTTAGTYTAPSEGHIYFSVYGGTGGGISAISINNVSVFSSGTTNSGEYRNTFSYLVNKNDVITWVATAPQSTSIIFYPLKGAN